MRKIAYTKRQIQVFTIIGENIEKNRGVMKKSELVKRANISRSTLDSAIAGNNITLETLIKIADALETPLADFFITKNQEKKITYETMKLLDQLTKSVEEKERENKEEQRKLMREELEKFFKDKK